MSNKPRNKISATNSGVNLTRCNTIPWPEWSDVKINSDKWDNEKGDHDKYDDSQPPILPGSLDVYTWKRPCEFIKKNSPDPVIYIPSSNPPDLFINNKHLLHSEFIRWFISSLNILNHSGSKGLVVNESLNFTTSYKNESWQGWHYIYSPNKLERKLQHNPLINPAGKYIVRLFFFGTWRMIEVDDKIPLDKDENPLLPRTENNHELWSMLLAKAMIKILSLDWSLSNNNSEIRKIHNFADSIQEIADLNPIYLLTGWPCVPLDISHVYPSDLWQLLSIYVKNCSELNGDSDNALRNEGRNELNNTKNHIKTNGIRRKTTMSRETLNEENIDVKENGSVLTLILFSNIEDDKEMRELSNFPVYVESISDSALNSEDVNKYASRGEMKNFYDYHFPIRQIRLFNHFNRISSGIQPKTVPNSSEIFSSWFDYHKLSKNFEKIFFFFKIKYFKCSIDISDTFQDNVHQFNSSKNIVRKYYQYFHQQMNDDSEESRRNIKNEPLYFLIDSVDDKFILFNFCVMPDANKPSLCIVERHCWLRRIVDPPLLKIKTQICTSRVLNLHPGRHLLRIYVQCRNSYHLSIFSDTIFHIGNQEEIEKLMTSESELFNKFSKNVENCLTNAINGFGNENNTEKLKLYYQSYLTDVIKFEDNENTSEVDRKKLNSLIHELFNESLVGFIKSQCLKNSENILHALRIFLINPTLGRDNLYAREEIINNYPLNLTPLPSIEDIYRRMSDDNDNDLSSINSRIKSLSRRNAAVIIQSYWRMYRIKLYIKIHKSPGECDKKIEETVKSLKVIRKIIKNNSLANVVRNFITKNSQLASLYPVEDDFPYMLHITEITGNITDFSRDWIPIIYLNVNVPDNCTIFSTINLFIQLPINYLRVFNNDTTREIYRTINSVHPYHFTRNNRGYTIFGYVFVNNSKNIPKIDSVGSEDDSKNKLRGKKKKNTALKREVEWKLHVTSMKHVAQFVFADDTSAGKSISSLPGVKKSKIYQISNNYIPNFNNKIFNVVIKTTNCCFMCLRVITSYPNVEIKISIVNNEGKCLKEACGKSEILLPVAYCNEDNFYRIEALVLDNSWPLTTDEWITVANVKEEKLYKVYEQHTNTTVINSGVSLNEMKKSVGSIKSNGKKEKKKIKEEMLKVPYWILQVFAKDGDISELFEDKTRGEEIRKLKEFWLANDPSRFERGRAMRMSFLREQIGENADNNGETSGSVDIEEKEEIRTLRSPTQLRLFSNPRNHH